MPAEVLQLVRMLPATEEALSQHYRVHLWSEIEDKRAWLETHATNVAVVATNGHHGIETDLVEALPALKLIAVNGVGVDRIDLDTVGARHVRVTNTPDVLTDDVADLGVALLLAVLRKLPAADQYVRHGKWPHAEMPLTRSLKGLQIGIVGFGRIGQAIAARLSGFGSKIAYSARHVNDNVNFDYYKSILHLAGKSDVLFVCVPGGAATAKLIDARILDALGPKGVLINVSRGSVVDESALVAALASARLGGAGLDVFANEPLVPEALFALDNVVLTPHIASATIETRTAMGQLMLDNIKAFFDKKPLLTEVIPAQAVALR